MKFFIFLTEIKGDIELAGPRIIAPSFAVAEDLLERDIEQGLSPLNTTISGILVEEIWTETP